MNISQSDGSGEVRGLIDIDGSDDPRFIELQNIEEEEEECES